MTPASQPTSQDVHTHLQAISDLLRHPHRLDASAQAALADLVDELDNALKVGAIPNDEATRLAAAASHFAGAVHRGDEAGVLSAAHDRLEEAVLALECRAPMAAGLTRRFVDALSNIGV